LIAKDIKDTKVMNHLISLQGVFAGYGGNDVVRDVTFDVSSGEFCALLGRNGSGKTTLLKAICGLLPAIRGECFIDGLNIARVNEYKRAKYISYIPQRLSTLRGVNVLDAVMMGLNAGLGALEHPSAKDKESAIDTLERVGVSHLAGEDFSTLSEGQKQLVVLARTLIQNTPVVLMDEPDNALDFLNRHQLMDIFLRLIHNEGKAALVTLHDPDLALNYCDRIVVLNDGKVVSDLTLAGSNLTDIETCLRMIYGDITVIEHSGRYIVIPPAKLK